MLGNYEHLSIPFLQFDRGKRGAAAGSCNAAAGRQLEASAVRGADQVAGIVAQKAVGREIHGPALVGTDVEPAAGTAVHARYHQIHRAFGAPDPVLAQAVFHQRCAFAKELQPLVAGLGIQ